MRSPLPIVVVLVALYAGQSGFGQEPVEAPPIDPRVTARQVLECAKLELRLYQQVEYPRELRHLESAIKFARAEVDVLKRRVREYDRHFNRFDIGKPVYVSYENTKLTLLDAELRLKDLEAELFALRRFRSDRCRVLELKVYQARAHLVNLEGGPAHIEPVQAAEPLDSV